jgi:hypothetical protein
MALAFSISPDSYGARLTVGPFNGHVEALHFQEPTTAEERRELFARSVQHVVLELSAYCNRRCGFCPNTMGTRLKGETHMPAAVFERLIADLASIDYAATIYFHLYNEPLAAPEVLLARMRQARDKLPRAQFSLNTNGDYLTPALLAELEAAGLNSLFVSVYGPNHGRWVESYIRKRVHSIAAQLGLKGKAIDRPDVQHSIAGKVDAVALTVSARNLWNTGYDRGGLVPELRVARSSPCLAPFTEFLVDHRGYALPCCNVYTDRPDHLAYTVGDLNDPALDIFSVYAGARLRAWRDGLLAFEPGGELCGGCSRGNDPALDTAANRTALTELRVGLGL